MKLDDTSFDSDIEDFKKVRNPQGYFNDNKNIHVNRFNIKEGSKIYNTVDGITIYKVTNQDTNQDTNKVYGEFGYVKFLKEKGKDKDTYKLIINELSKPKITLILEEIMSSNGIKKARSFSTNLKKRIKKWRTG